MISPRIEFIKSWEIFWPLLERSRSEEYLVHEYCMKENSKGRVYQIHTYIRTYIHTYIYSHIYWLIPTGTLGSRGYFFLIDTDGSRRSRVNEAQSDEEKKIIFSSALCVNAASVSIRKKYPLEPRVPHRAFRSQCYSNDIKHRKLQTRKIIN